jgi:hypothetical protein
VEQHQPTEIAAVEDEGASANNEEINLPLTTVGTKDLVPGNEAHTPALVDEGVSTEKRKLASLSSPLTRTILSLAMKLTRSYQLKMRIRVAPPTKMESISPSLPLKRRILLLVVEFTRPHQLKMSALLPTTRNPPLPLTRRILPLVM